MLVSREKTMFEKMRKRFIVMEVVSYRGEARGNGIG